MVHLFVFLYLFLDLPILFARLLVLVPLLRLAATPHRLEVLSLNRLLNWETLIVLVVSIILYCHLILRWH